MFIKRKNGELRGIVVKIVIPFLNSEIFIVGVKICSSLTLRNIAT
jgi:hypothetical protein